MTAQLFLVAIPLICAGVGCLTRDYPRVLKVYVLLGLIVTLGLVLIQYTLEMLPESSAALALQALLPVAAFSAVLGQPVHRSLSAAWLLTLILLGLGLGILAFEPPLSLLFFFLLFALIGLLLFQARHRAGVDLRWGMGTLAVGMLACGIAAATAPPVSAVAVTVVCATALPLVPFHKSYVAVASGLPGNLPAFVAVLLPVAGYHGLVTMLPTIPEFVLDAAAFLALSGMVYGSLRPFAQSRAALVVAYGGVAFFGIVWWYVAASGTAPPPTVVFLIAVALATSGLHLAWSMLRARFGDIALRGVTDLARPMPRFAIAVSLLAIAALGLPPFGVYSGFVGMLLDPSFTWSAYLAIILFAWLAASSYLFSLAQGLLFSRPRPEHRPADLRLPELTALTIMVALLVALSLMPLDFFGSDQDRLYQMVQTTFPAWNK
jgi:NADH-quinone oxidoreductase subunit M